MRSVFRWTSLVVVVIAFSTCALAQKQTPSVADAARSNRKQKQPQTEKVTWTNDNIVDINKGLATEDGKPSETDKAAGAADAKDADKPAATEAKKECDKTKDADCAKADKDAADKSAEYKKKLQDMQNDLADLQKEASLNEREWKLAQAAYYGDAGTQLRNQKKFADDQSGHQKDQERLQKAIQDAQKKIDDLKEQARKDGVSL